MKTLLQHVQSTIQGHALIAPGAILLVGVSGGADSIALLYALSKLAPSLNIRLAVAHLNHGIRPEAEADADFVAECCQSLGIPCYRETVDVPKMVADSSESLEMVARQARYRFFADTANTIGAEVVATAHTQDDQAETVLLKLCRGAGSSGLNGIACNTIIHGLRVIRPILNATRAEVEAFLREENITWREDSTNTDTRMQRNRIRHDVLPQLEAHLNPRIKEALARTADILAEENAYMTNQAENALQHAIGDSPEGLSVEAVCQLPRALQRRVLQQWLIRNGISAPQLRFEVVERLVQLATSDKGSGCITLNGSEVVLREYTQLRFCTHNTEAKEVETVALSIPGETVLDDFDIKVTTQLRTGFEKNQQGPLGKLPAEATIRWDSDKKQEILVRSWQPGDRIHPIGLSGSCKLHDLFVDAKIPKAIRSKIPVFVCGNEVIWLPGYRIAKKWAVLDEKQCSLQLRVNHK